jgi:YidC/Oxa1 family membrane protein insertase
MSIANVLFATGEVTINDSDSVSVSVETSAFKIRFDKNSAAIDGIKLKSKKFSDELMESWLPGNKGALPFAFFVGSDEVRTWKIEKLVETGGRASLIFTSDSMLAPSADTSPTSLSNVSVIKQFSFDPVSPKIEVKVKLVNRSKERVLLEKGAFSYELVLMANLGASTVDDELLYSKDKAMTSAKCSKESYVGEVSAKLAWVGAKDSFYCVVTKLDESNVVLLTRFRREGIDSGNPDKFKNGYPIDARVRFAPSVLEPGQVKEQTFEFLPTTKSYDILAKYQLEEIAGLGTLSLFLLGILKFFYNLTKNWGLAIILLTILIRIALSPLNAKQMKNMREMQKLQPFMAELKKKYANDTKRFNEEVMRLYKEHGVNPLGGCLPLLIQLPILFALFNALRSSIDFKNEPFLWLKDLAAPDPLLLLPIGIAVLTHIQQQQMSVDPDQARTMAFMPILLFFITYQFPSGVLLYWFLSQLLQSQQQSQLAKKDEGARPKTVKEKS